jgi:CHAT domain-containing protein/tetratricopeptide (TPR) repeat protein
MSADPPHNPALSVGSDGGMTMLLPRSAYFLAGLLLAVPLAAQDEAAEASGPADLHRQVVALHKDRKLTEALPLAEAAVRLQREAQPGDSVELGTYLQWLGWTHEKLARWEEAERVFREAVQIRGRVLGEDHPDYATSLNSLGYAYFRLREYEKSEALFIQALAIRRRHPGAGSGLLLQTLGNLSNLYIQRNRQPDARPLCAEAAEIARREFGGNDVRYADALRRWASVCWLSGFPDESEPAFLEAIGIYTALGERCDPQRASALAGLGGLYTHMGLFDKAEQAQLESIEMRHRLGSDSDVALSEHWNNLGLLYQAMGRYEEAEALLKRTLAVRKEAFGEDSVPYSNTASVLASVYYATRRYREAEPLLRRAWEIRTKAFPEGTYGFRAWAIAALAQLYVATGEYEKAEPLLRQVVDVSRPLTDQRNLPPPHLLATLCSALGRYDEALELRRYVSSIEDRAIPRIFSVTSERDKLAYLSLIDEYLAAHLTLVRDAFADDPEAVSWAMGTVLRRKGSVLESLLRQRQAVTEDPGLARKFEEWRKTADQLGGPAAGETPGEQAEGPQALAERQQQLEAELSRLSADSAFDQEARQIDAETAAAFLRPGSALVETVRTPIHNPKATWDEERWLPDHYLAFVLPSGKQPKLVDLGEAEAIDEAVANWRAEFTGSLRSIGALGEAAAEERLAQRAKALYDLAFAPIEPHLSDCSSVVIAPDGQLNLVPFGALAVGRGQYLADTYSFDYVSSGRDLLRFGRPDRIGEGALVVANPSFDMSAADRLAQRQQTSAEDIRVAQLPAGDIRSAEMRGGKFAPLPGTAGEAEEVGELLKGIAKPVLCVGPAALEEVVKAIRSPRVLHLATHGFFIEEQRLTGGGPGLGIDEVRARAARMAAAGLENPLLRSGLALAGANRLADEHPEGLDDGILTALEISGMDLAGTDLVVLSACDTGLGEVRNGEGVYGLRRAFVHAGADTVVMSLAKVPDAETRELIVEFYRRWLEGSGKCQALHDAALAIREKRQKDHGAAHPIYWGAFIAVGDPG